MWQRRQQHLLVGSQQKRGKLSFDCAAQFVSLWVYSLQITLRWQRCLVKCSWCVGMPSKVSLTTGCKLFIISSTCAMQHQNALLACLKYHQEEATGLLGLCVCFEVQSKASICLRSACIACTQEHSSCVVQLRAVGGSEAPIMIAEKRKLFCSVRSVPFRSSLRFASLRFASLRFASLLSSFLYFLSFFLFSFRV